MSDLFKKVRSEQNIFSAWRHVKRSALNSSNGDIRGAAAEFEHLHQRHLRRIIDQLRKGNFVFDEVHGVLADKKKREQAGKAPRPIAIATLKNRVVQRAILQVLQPRKARNLKDIDTRHQTINDPALGQINAVNTSKFGIGGLLKPYGGVRPAMSVIMDAMREGATYYYRSDIKAFFTDIPVAPVVAFVRQQTGDDALADLFAKALEVHLGNKEELRGYADLFPANGRGVAQGSSLSAFAGNVLLYDMDHAVNDLNVAAVRYIDDIMIVAESESELSRAIALTESHLARYGFKLYSPSGGSDKAEKGICVNSFGFLGCTLQPNKCTPSRQSVTRVKEDIGAAFSKSQDAIRTFAREGKRFDPELSESATLQKLGRKIYGWQKSFSFSTEATPFEHLDRYVFERTKKYRGFVFRETKSLSDDKLATVMGMPSTEQMFRSSQQKQR